MWEGVGDRIELQHIDPPPTLLAITAFLSRSPGLLDRGPWAQPLWVLVFTTASYLQHIWSPTQSGARGSLCWVLSFSTASYLQLVWSPTDCISCALSYIIAQRPPSSCGRHNFALIQPVHGQGYNILIFLDWMHLLFTLVDFLFWQPGRVVGQYTTVVAIEKGAFGSLSIKVCLI